jgi:hypothetical protein
MAKKQGQCIFCGGLGLTREHIWADWASAYIKKNVTRHGKLESIIHSPGKDPKMRLMEENRAVSVASVAQTEFEVQRQTGVWGSA